jgi:hypothetical protein
MGMNQTINMSNLQINTNQRYLLLQQAIFAIPQLENIMWESQENHQARPGGYATVKSPILNVIIKDDNATWSDSFQLAVKEWMKLAQKTLRQLDIKVKNSISFVEFMDIYDINGEFDFDPALTLNEAISTYGWESIQSDCGRWREYFDFENRQIIARR